MEKLTITPAIWRLKVYQATTVDRKGLHGIAWNDGHAYATDGSSLVAIKDAQEVPPTWRVLLSGKTPSGNITVPMAIGITAIKQPSGGYSVVEIYDSKEPPLSWKKVVPAKKDSTRMLAAGVLKTMLDASGQVEDNRLYMRFYDSEGLSPMRLQLPDDVIAVIMPCRMD